MAARTPEKTTGAYRNKGDGAPINDEKPATACTVHAHDIIVDVEGTFVNAALPRSPGVPR
jgi:hypothetical protein